MSLFDYILKTIEKFNMLKINDKVLISLSGGPDSVFLTYFLKHISEEFKLNLFAFHLDHLTRDGQSTEDAEFVTAFCKDLNIKLFKEKLDVYNFCKERKLNFQEGARDIRKKLLIKYSKENEINKIAIAHTADDNVETFFMNLLRGSGLKGLSSIRPVDGKIIRPLLYVFKKDILEYLDSQNISYRVDYSNFQRNYFRNKIRLDLIPYIETNFSKNVKNKVITTIDILRMSNDFIQDSFTKALNSILKKQGINDINDIRTKGFISLEVKDILKFDDIIKINIFLKIIEVLKGDKKDIKEKNLQDILKLCNLKGETKQIAICKGIKLKFVSGKLYIFDSNKLTFDDLIKHDLKLNKLPLFNKFIEDEKITVFKENDLNAILGNKILDKKIVRKVNKSNFNLEFKLLNFDEAVKVKTSLKNLNKNEAYFDLERISFPIIVRKCQKGDKFKPLGMNCYKKLHDYFIDEKISTIIRVLTPILCDKDKIIWICPYRISDEVKVTENTKKILYLRAIT